MLPYRPALFGLFFLLFSFPLAARAEEEQLLRVLYLYNFTQYITWPLSTAQGSEGFRLCTNESAASFPAFDTLAQHKVHQNAIRPLRLEKLTDIRSCHMAYLAGLSDTQLDQALRAAQGLPVLLVVGVEAAAPLGAGISLFKNREERLEFDINLSALRKAGLSAGSPLLKLARRVY